MNWKILLIIIGSTLLSAWFFYECSGPQWRAQPEQAWFPQGGPTPIDARLEGQSPGYPEEFAERLKELEKQPEVYAKLMKEIRNRDTPGASTAEINAYIDELLDFPWGKEDELNIDVPKAREILDRDHQGLEKAKTHILEYLSVMKRAPESSRAPILCLIGPPGVGKTTLAKSIAEATGRKFVRVALGGATDESRIRGSLRMYIGAKPGEIVKAIRSAGTMNPLILLDELDKLGGRSPITGDPSAALLEVLDPAQNKNFKDVYFDLGMDLSKVLFIATANSYDIAPALLDRLDVVELSSYTLEEKMVIAKKNLVPGQIKENGLSDEEFQITDEALKKVIVEYTAEAGVRELTRVIGKLCRKAITRLDEGKLKTVKITPDMLQDFLGMSMVPPSTVFDSDKVGATQGLAWTEVGGRILVIEAAITAGTGQITMTGNLGDVSQESIKNALTVAKGLLTQYKLKSDFFKDKDVHVNWPTAVRKDGPSAGAAIVTSIISAAAKIPVSKSVGMTGEITLQGDVLAIGGLKEKLIAAHSAGLKTVLIPDANKMDLEEVPEVVKKELKIIAVKRISDVLNTALVKTP